MREVFLKYKSTPNRQGQKFPASRQLTSAVPSPPPCRDSIPSQGSPGGGRGIGGWSSSGPRPPWGESLGGEPSSFWRSRPFPPPLPLPPSGFVEKIPLGSGAGAEVAAKGRGAGGLPLLNAPRPASSDASRVAGSPLQVPPFTSPSYYRLLPNSFATEQSPIPRQSPARGVGRDRVRRLAGMSPGGWGWKPSIPFWSQL